MLFFFAANIFIYAAVFQMLPCRYAVYVDAAQALVCHAAMPPPMPCY